MEVQPPWIAYRLATKKEKKKETFDAHMLVDLGIYTRAINKKKNIETNIDASVLSWIGKRRRSSRSENQEMQMGGPLMLTWGVSQCGLAIYIKKYLKEKKNYENSSISPCKNIMLKKIFWKKPKSFKI